MAHILHAWAINNQEKNLISSIQNRPGTGLVRGMYSRSLYCFFSFKFAVSFMTLNVYAAIRIPVMN